MRIPGCRLAVIRPLFITGLFCLAMAAEKMTATA
jgi:hypothetical protein